MQRGLDLRPQLGLVVLDDQQVVAARLHDLLAELALTEQGVAGEHPSVPVQAGDEDGGPGQFRFGLSFPNLIPVFSPIDFNYLRIDPIDAETIRLRGRGFDGGGEMLVPREFRAAAFDTTNKQDIAVVERVQRGLRARGLPAAVHSDLRESRITHFETLVARALGG